MEEVMEDVQKGIKNEILLTVAALFLVSYSSTNLVGYVVGIEAFVALDIVNLVVSMVCLAVGVVVLEKGIKDTVFMIRRYKKVKGQIEGND